MAVALGIIEIMVMPKVLRPRVFRPDWDDLEERRQKLDLALMRARELLSERIYPVDYWKA